MYEDFYQWAFDIGGKIKKETADKDKGIDLLRKLIFSIRAEETLGRFLDKLSETIAEYRTNRNMRLDLRLDDRIYRQTWAADRFYYLKSAILAGLLNSLSA
jgi:hypothetical protein